MSELTNFRKSKDRFMAEDHQSPLTHEQQHSFTSLSYFDEDPSMRFVQQPKKYADQETVEMQTSTGDIASYIRWASVAFEIEGESSTLTLFKDVDSPELFLPFADATSGQDTYGAGRYVDPHMTADGSVVLDFNYAYNPYCAYNERWSCPLTPGENRLKVPVRAGEKNFKEQ